jgi:hypothetical protein
MNDPSSSTVTPVRGGVRSAVIHPPLVAGKQRVFGTESYR